MTHNLNSSHLKTVEYDGDSRKMRVTFHNGATYEYADVAHETVSDLVQAKSHGKHWRSIMHTLKGCAV